MATPQLSPGVLVREVDLTVGRADNVLDNIGAIAGPFRIGPVDEAIDISTEQELINTFGKPLSTDSQYEYWMSASNFLSYGGVLKVARTANTNLRNANAGVGIASTSLNLQNNVIVNVGGLSTTKSDLLGSYSIGISSTRLILSQGIGTAGATGIVTFFNVEGNLERIRTHYEKASMCYSQSIY